MGRLKMMNSKVIIIENNINEAEAISKIKKGKSGFFSKNFQEIQKISLCFCPYWFVFCTTKINYLLKHDKKLNFKVLVEGMEGDVIITYSLPRFKEKILINDLSEGTEVLTARIGKEEAIEKTKRTISDIILRKSLLIKDIAHSISWVKQLYYPYWIMLVKDRKNTNKIFSINAVNGEIEPRLAYLYSQYK